MQCFCEFGSAPGDFKSNIPGPQLNSSIWILSTIKQRETLCVLLQMLQLLFCKIASVNRAKVTNGSKHVDKPYEVQMLFIKRKEL